MPLLLLARRFLFGIARARSLSSMLTLCIASTCISTFALTLIIGIATGFQEATKQALQGFHSDCVLQAPCNKALNAPALTAVLEKEYAHIVAATSPTSYRHAIVQTDRSSDLSHVVIVQGIAPERDAQTRPRLHRDAALAQHLAKPGTVVVGKKLAQTLGLHPLDQLNLLFIAENQTDAINLEKALVTVQGTCTTGIDEMDERIVLCSLATFQELFPDAGITQINIKLQPNVTAADLVHLQQRLQLDLFTWQELYPALLDALALERTAMFIIVLLVAAIASVATIALLMMYIIHQQPTLAVLRAMGMPLNGLRQIFTLLGSAITFFATTLGLLLTLGVSWLLNTYQLIRLPDAYYITHVPAQIEMSTLLLVLVSMTCVSLITSWLATSQIKKMNLTLLLKR